MLRRETASESKRKTRCPGQQAHAPLPKGGKGEKSAPFIFPAAMRHGRGVLVPPSGPHFAVDRRRVPLTRMRGRRSIMSAAASPFTETEQKRISLELGRHGHRKKGREEGPDFSWLRLSRYACYSSMRGRKKKLFALIFAECSKKHTRAKGLR